MVVLLGLAVVLTAAARLRGWLSYCGRRTLQIYLPHTVATGGTRILLLRLGVESVFVHLVLGLVAGIFAPPAAGSSGRALRVRVAVRAAGPAARRFEAHNGGGDRGPGGAVSRLSSEGIK